MIVSTKSLGKKKPLFADFSVPLPPNFSEGDGTTLRDIIEHIVRDEVRKFRERQQNRQFLRALTSRQIEEAAERGKVEMGGSEVGIQSVDEEQAVGNALLAFEDGIYLVVIDDVEQRRLDQQVFLQPDSRITFVRLTMLAGA